MCPLVGYDVGSEMRPIVRWWIAWIEAVCVSARCVSLERRAHNLLQQAALGTSDGLCDQCRPLESNGSRYKTQDYVDT